MQNLKRRKLEMNFIIDNLSVVIPTKDDHIRIKENLDLIIQFLSENIKQYEIIVSNGSTVDSETNKQINL